MRMNRGGAKKMPLCWWSPKSLSPEYTPASSELGLREEFCTDAVLEPDVSETGRPAPMALEPDCTGKLPDEELSRCPGPALRARQRKGEWGPALASCRLLPGVVD